MNLVELYIARRYLTSRRQMRFINVIGYISIVGISIGVAALLVALSVFNGFSGVVTGVLLGFDPHIRVEKRDGMTEEEASRVGQILKIHPEVRAYAPYVTGKGMLVASSFTKVVFVRGVDAERIGAVSGLGEKIVLGRLTLKEESGAIPEIVIGIALVDRLASVVGSSVSVYSPYGIQSLVAGIGAPESMKFRVSGIFESNNREYDADYAYISLADAQLLFHMEGKYNGIEMRLWDFHQAEDLRQVLSKELPPDYTVRTWYDLHQSLYSVMTIERWSAYVLLSLIILVATFNMLGSLTMGVIEKQRDIGVLKAMGMTGKAVIRVFMVEGLIIGVVGTVLGIGLGLAVLLLQIKYSIFSLDTSIYIIPAIPVEIRWTDFVAIAFASMGLSFLAAYYPSRRAARTLVAEALRWE